MAVTIAKIAYVLVGIVLLAVVLAGLDLADVWARASGIGWGLLAVLAIYFVGFVGDAFTWQMAMATVPVNARWLYRTWKVRMVGEVFNTVMPAAGMGGEPVKAALLKRYYGLGYREATAGIILAKTINMFSLIAFLGGGFVLILMMPLLPGSYLAIAGVGLAAFSVGTALFFLIQRCRVTSLAGRWLARFSFARRIDAVLHLLQDMDDRLVHFYRTHHGRFAGSLAIGVGNWVMGVLEIYVTMMFLEHPISFREAWVVEATAQLARAATFFIPASIGAQEGAFLFAFSAIAGSPELGVAVALTRRFREVLWLVWGVLLGSLYGLQPAHGGNSTQAESDPADTTGAGRP